MIRGLKADGTLDHVPTVGEQIWVNILDGSLGSAPSSITAITGYVKATGWTITLVGLVSASTTIAANQTLGQFSGLLIRGN